ncbi:MAG: hypothetical protein V1793_08050, partial [Pseudomonadota bacterium]
SLPVSHEDKKQIKDKFIMREACKEAISQKAMADPGETALKSSDTMADNGFFLYHGVLHRALTSARRLFHNPVWGSDPLQSPAYRKNGTGKTLSLEPL